VDPGAGANDVDAAGAEPEVLKDGRGTDEVTVGREYVDDDADDGCGSEEGAG
jgi:hypothetical protein